MGKAKMFGGISAVFGLIMGVLAYVVVHMQTGASFTNFLIYTYLPILLVTVGIFAILIGILLLIYG